MSLGNIPREEAKASLEENGRREKDDVTSSVILHPPSDDDPAGVDERVEVGCRMVPEVASAVV